MFDLVNVMKEILEVLKADIKKEAKKFGLGK